MIDEKKVRRYAEYLDTNLATFLPNAMGISNRHRTYLQKSFQSGLNDEEISQVNALGDFRLKTEAALLPYLTDGKGFYTIYDIEKIIVKNNWMPYLKQKSLEGNDMFYTQSFTDQIQAVLLYSLSQIDENILKRVLTTPCIGEQYLSRSDKTTPIPTQQFKGSLFSR